MSTSTETTLRLTRLINAGPAAVFAAWTEPEQIRQWSCPEGLQVADSQVDLRVGGPFLLEMHGPDGAVYTAFGTWREIDPPHRLVYTWDWKQPEHSVGETVITVEFLARGAQTEVVMVHALLPTIQQRDAHSQGWTSCLDKLARKFA